VTILAVDTATAILAGALSTQEGNWYMEVDAGQRHSELLMDVTDQMMKIAGLRPTDLDLVACMKGPGSFTGLRIGFATAKGLCLSLGIPLRAIPTLDCMAAPYSQWPGMVLPVIDAKKHCYFTALYRRGERLSEYMDKAAADIGGLIADTSLQHDLILLTGPDAAMLQSELPDILEHTLWNRIRLDPGCRKGRARELLDLVAIEVAKKDSIANDAVFSGPLYVRKSDAELYGGVFY
jgi:tRNA threonylcarbamoyladenosine biosynthesis protein TsaB